MQPFILTAGSSDVNGTYSFAKEVKSIPQFWCIKTTTKQPKSKKSKIESNSIIYKIRGNGHLPQFGSDFKQCWILQTTQNERTKQLYAAPMININEQFPPNKGWICIEGVEPVPNIQPLDLISIKKKVPSNFPIKCERNFRG